LRRGTNVITHNGGNGIFFADFFNFVDEDTVVIEASNSTQHSVERHTAAIMRILFPPKPTR
jgi:hypothetical protein